MVIEFGYVGVFYLAELATSHYEHKCDREQIGQVTCAIVEHELIDDVFGLERAENGNVYETGRHGDHTNKWQYEGPIDVFDELHIVHLGYLVDL